MRFRVEGLGFGVWGFGFGVRGVGFGFWILGFGFWVLGLGVRCLGIGLGVWGWGFQAACWVKKLRSTRVGERDLGSAVVNEMRELFDVDFKFVWVRRVPVG